MNHVQAHYAISKGWPGIPFTLAGVDIAGMTWSGPDPKPTLAEVEAVWETFEAQWLTEQAAAVSSMQAEEQRLATIKTDTLRQNLIAQLSTATAAQISTYVDNNVTDLASARTMFKRILLVLATMSRD